jgi:hypothetical protein
VDSGQRTNHRADGNFRFDMGLTVGKMLFIKATDTGKNNNFNPYNLFLN